MAPSILSILAPEKRMGKQIMETAIITGKSSASEISETGIPEGTNKVVIPSTQSMLKILLPMTLPIAISR